MNIIEVKNLSKKFSDTEIPALDGVSFSIAKEEFVAIMGPSGSGKSTLLHILGILDEPSSGDYIFDGKNIKDYQAHELAKFRNQQMGFIFQSFNLLAKTSVLNNVKMPLLYSNIKEHQWTEIAQKCINSVGIFHRTHYDVSKLSGGEKQRVAIARALVNNPQVIFADEPTGNLDSKSGGQVMEILETLNNQGHTIILITHETYTAKYAQRIITLKDGKIETDEQVSQRLTNAKAGFTK